MPSKSKSPHPLSPDQPASDFQSAAAMKSRKFKTRMWNPERMDISNEIVEALIFCWCGRVMNKCPPSVLGFRGALSCTEAEVHSCTTGLLASLCSGPSVTGKYVWIPWYVSYISAVYKHQWYSTPTYKEWETQKHPKFMVSMYHLQKHKAGKQWFVFEGSWHDIVGVDMFPSLKVKFRFPRKVFEVPFWKTQPWTFDLGLSKGKTTNSSRFPNQICHLGVCSILWCINMSMYTIFNFDHPKWVYAINLCSKETMCSWSWCLVKKHYFFRLTPSMVHWFFVFDDKSPLWLVTSCSPLPRHLDWRFLKHLGKLNICQHEVRPSFIPHNIFWYFGTSRLPQ